MYRSAALVLLLSSFCLLVGCQYQPRYYGGNIPDPLHSDDPGPDPDPDPHRPPQEHRWKYIVVHHSATNAGSAADFDRQHKDRGWQGVGYHFVIGNGTRGVADGQVETTFRWTKQLRGAHCKDGNMNVEGVGICLVGDFSNKQPSAAQMRSLVALIRSLQKRYEIPTTKVIGHNGVRGAITQCPGARFSIAGLRRSLQVQ